MSTTYFRENKSYKEFGLWMRDQRNSRQIRGRELAEDLGLAQASISNFETRGMTYDTLKKHATTMGWDVPPAQELLETYTVDKEYEPQSEDEAYGRWFRQQRLEREMTHQAVAEQLGLTRSAVFNFESRGITYHRLIEHTNTLGWDLPKPEEILAADPDPTPQDLTTLPISSAAASMGYNPAQDEFEIISQIQVSRSWLPASSNANNLALLPATGDSMEPTYKANDTLLVDRSVDTFQSDGVFVFRSDAGLFVKRVTRRVTGRVVVSSDNTSYPSEVLEKEELANVQVLGKVLGVWAYRLV